MTVDIEKVTVYPSLSRDIGERLMVSYEGEPLDAVRDVSQLGHPSSTWIGDGQRVTENDLADLRETIRTLADECGFPNSIARSRQVEFDRRLGTELHRRVVVPEFYAAQSGMWVFLSCVVFPELAHWRYPGTVHRDRFLGGDRDLLRSRWWRAWSLEDLTFAEPGCTPLGEDEFTNIMERPTIGYTPKLSRAVRDCIWRHEGACNGQRMTFTRGLTRRIVSERAFRSFDGLSAETLAEELDMLADEVLAAMEDSNA